jgi:7,8-dihydropterin-6-yl-methyl-4-(beta-D-ribofuranosyl)aminobenzene 5'-phosphate synthase
VLSRESPFMSRFAFPGQITLGTGMKIVSRCVLGVLLLAAGGLARAETPAAPVKALKITILSTMLADGPELGEWGFAALVEVDGHRILFDTGAHTDVVLKNARSLGVDLTTVPEVILSHNHWDHIGGFMTLRDAVREQAPGALGRTHVGEGIFYPRVSIRPDAEDNQMRRIKADYEKTGGVFVEHGKPVQLYPGVWLTGPVPRKYPERNWSGSGKVKTPAGVVEDNLPEDTALVFDTAEGLVVLTGCGHAGVVNICDYARAVIRPARIHALIGGIHLFNAKAETLQWTAGKLKEFGLGNFIGAHCTGVETVYQFRQDLGLDRAHAVVGAVGAGFELGQGIDPRNIAR